MELELATDDIKDAIYSSTRHISMDAPINEEEDSSLYDVYVNNDSPSPDKKLINDSLSKEIERSLSTLSQKEAVILRYFFGLNGITPLTLEEIGEKLDLTRERVRQIKEKAIKRLKIINRSKILKTYLGQ